MTIGQLLKLLMPIGIILITILVNTWLGLALFILYIIYNLFKNRVNVYSKIGSNNYMKGNLPKALEFYEKAYSTGQAIPRISCSYAFLLLKAGEFEKANTVLSSISESLLSPYDKNALYANKALYCWKTNNINKAIDFLNEIPKDFENSTLYGCIIIIYLSTNMNAKALDIAKKAYEYNASNINIADATARSYYVAGDIDKSKEILEILLKLNPVIPEPYINMAIHNIDDEKYEEAKVLLLESKKYILTEISYFTKEFVEGLLEQVS